MRILFNRWWTVGKRTGIGNYARQLLAHLRPSPGETVTAFPSQLRLTWCGMAATIMDTVHAWKSRWQGFNPLASLQMLNVFSPLAGKARLALKRTILRGRDETLFSDRFDLYHEPNFIPLPSSIKTVTTLHDLSVVLHPESHPLERVQWHEKYFEQSLSQSCHFLAVSEFTRGQVVKHLGIPASRVTCVHNGVGPEFVPLPAEQVVKTLRRYRLPRRYLLCVGTIEPRKNLLRLMRAYCAVPPKVRGDCPLLLAGQWGWNVDAERNFYESEARHCGVRHIGYLPDHALPAVYNGARALLYPSLYEGFGLPPLEMLACGGAVVASRIEPVVEVVSNCAGLVHPEDADGWSKVIENAIVDDDWLQQLRGGALTQARNFSWQRCASETWQVYRSVLQPKRSEAPLPMCMSA